MSYRVVFSPQAEEQLVELYHYIANAASPAIAVRYTEAIVSYCESLHMVPLSGTKRDDVRPGLCITNYPRRWHRWPNQIRPLLASQMQPRNDE